MSAKEADLSTSSKQESNEEQQERPRHFKEQFEDEDVKLVFRKHPIVMRKGLLLSCGVLLLGPLYTLILTYVNKTDPPSMSFFFISLLISFILALAVLFPWWVRWYFSVYIMTDQRFIQQSRSLLSINFVDISLDQIQMINYEISGLEETLLHYGTITVQTYVGDLVIREVYHPERVQKKMVQQLRELGIHPAQRPMQAGEVRTAEE